MYFLLKHCRLFALTPPAYVCILVTLLDTRTVPGELKWAASPSEGGVSGSLFLFLSSPLFFFKHIYCLQPVLSLENTLLISPSHTHTRTHILAHTWVGNCK